MSIRTFDGNWIIAGDGIATSDDCCCDSSCASDSDCPSGQSCCDGVCQEESCAGACCTCSATPSTWNYDIIDNPADPLYGLKVFCTVAERNQELSEAEAELQGRADAAAQALINNGWTCPGTSWEVSTDQDNNAYDGNLQNPDCAADAVVYRMSPLWWGVSAQCCGTVDTGGAPIDLGNGLQAYPCVGPYTYDTCTDDVAAEDCCGVHHPGEACEYDPEAQLWLTCDEFI